VGGLGDLAHNRVPQHGEHWGAAALGPSHPLAKSARRYKKFAVSSAENAEATRQEPDSAVFLRELSDSAVRSSSFRHRN
jgi:hypothetical protein